ncbi:MAG TPA: hypothetical protein PL009_03735 [Flavipsychrobacter sp.]|nr:hypothetical protein [Flavipsychrobacter sp.]
MPKTSGRSRAGSRGLLAGRGGMGAGHGGSRAGHGGSRAGLGGLLAGLPASNYWQFLSYSPPFLQMAGGFL